MYFTLSIWLIVALVFFAFCFGLVFGFWYGKYRAMLEESSSSADNNNDDSDQYKLI